MTVTTSAPYPTTPVGHDLTEPGTTLALGQPATIAWRPSVKHTGALRLTPVSLERPKRKLFHAWNLDAKSDESTPYFLRVNVRNVGEASLGGDDIPLLLVDDRNTLIPPSTFEGTFKPCPGGTLPRGFATGDHEQFCLVFLVPRHGQAVAVSFRPSQDFNPIVWLPPVDSEPSREPSAKADHS